MDKDPQYLRERPTTLVKCFVVTPADTKLLALARGCLLPCVVIFLVVKFGKRGRHTVIEYKHLNNSRF